MKRVVKYILLGVVISAVFLSVGAWADNTPTGKTTLSGSIYCISSDGTMHGKEGVCPVDHAAHILITDDGEAYMLGGSTEILKQIRSASLKMGAKVKVEGDVSTAFRAVDVKWWEEYETVGD